jgi:hypothetical protein
MHCPLPLAPGTPAEGRAAEGNGAAAEMSGTVMPPCARWFDASHTATSVSLRAHRISAANGLL